MCPAVRPTENCLPPIIKEFTNKNEFAVDNFRAKEYNTIAF